MKTLAEVAAMQRETAARQKEAEIAEARRKAEADERHRQLEKKHRELTESLEKANKNWGGYTQNESDRLEDEFYEGLNESKQIGKVRLDEVLLRYKASHEYDLIGISKKSQKVFVGEIKHKLLPQDVEKFVKEALPQFPKDYPGIADKRCIYGMVGGASITKDAEEEAKKQGLYILRLNNRKLVVKNTNKAKPFWERASRQNGKAKHL